MMTARTAPGRAFGGMCAATIAISAFLLFQVQPIISKTILPWFGGSPGVWSTCLLFFQLVLLAGYAYAHLLISRFSARSVMLIHITLLLAALFLLPITPGTNWKPQPEDSPAGQILLLLLANLGLAYFLVASTAPLVQAWFARRYPDEMAYRLYALSNTASLTALLTYPMLVEPSMTTQTQCLVWSLGFGLFALCSGALSVLQRRIATPANDPSGRIDQKGTAGEKLDRRKANPGNEVPSPQPSITPLKRLAWLLLPALATLMLLSVTNHLCQQLLVIPFLWIAPLSLYLVSFIICFDNPRWYVARWYALAAAMLVLLVSNMMLSGSVDELYTDLGVGFQMTSLRLNILIEGGLILLLQFLVSMVCHGELVRLRPPAAQLTAFYLLVAAGGALGGAFVALLCPLIFATWWEFKLGLLASFLLALFVVYREGRKTWFARMPILKVATLSAGLVGTYLVFSVSVGTNVGIPVESRRSFYGVYAVRDFPLDDPARSGRALYHGNTMHGYQFHAQELRNRPTLYYESGTGIGLTLSRLAEEKLLKVGVIGLGVGTLAAYGRPQDVYRFYEIDTEVIDVCREYFTFLDDSPAAIEIAPGDARLVLEQEPPQLFDVLVIDAFSDDAVPTHLLSAEAFALYLRHLTPDGVLAFHVSTRHLNLGLVVQRLADHFDRPTRYVVHNPEILAIEHPPSIWMLVTTNETILNDAAIRAQSHVLPERWRQLPLWTDKFSSLRELLW